MSAAGISHAAYRRIRADIRGPKLIDLSLPLSNLARFALMRSTRPVAVPSLRDDPQGLIDHLYAVRDWARTHDHSRCYCADSGTCPFCSLARCDACDGATDAEQVCRVCLAAADEEINEQRDVDRTNRLSRARS